MKKLIMILAVLLGFVLGAYFAVMYLVKLWIER